MLMYRCVVVIKAIIQRAGQTKSGASPPHVSRGGGILVIPIPFTFLIPFALLRSWLLFVTVLEGHILPTVIYMQVSERWSRSDPLRAINHEARCVQVGILDTSVTMRVRENDWPDDISRGTVDISCSICSRRYILLKCGNQEKQSLSHTKNPSSAK